MTDKQLSQLQQQLQKQLDSIIDKLQHQHQLDQQRYQHKSWWQRYYLYGKESTKAAAHGSKQAVVATGEMAISLFEQAEHALVFAAEFTVAETLDDEAKIAELEARAKATSKHIITKLSHAKRTLSLLKQDKVLYSMLTNFAKRYLHALDTVMILKDVGTFIGGVIPAIIVGLLTHNPEFLGVALGTELAADVLEAGGTLEEIAKAREALQQADDESETLNS